MTEDLDCHRRHPPWCAILLVLSATACNVVVLIGNRKVAASVDELGASADGWSRVGLGVAHSLQDELAGKMHEVSEVIFSSLGHLDLIQDRLDMVLSLAGNMTDAGALADPGKPALLQFTAAEMDLGHPDMAPALALVITHAVHKVMTSVMKDISKLLARLMEMLKPALVQIGKWILTFGSEIQSGLSMFSVTLDRVQKLFDQTMARLHGHGDNREAVLEEVFDLFDANKDGYVGAAELRDVSELYSITELQGNFSEELVAVYGEGSGSENLLEVSRLGRLLDDPAVPGVSARVLRTYAQRLSEVSGQVDLARYRSEVAFALVQYLGVVAAKNMSKVQWVSDRLGNGSLPMEFTASVMAQLCLNEDNPNKLASSSIGELAITAMYGLHPNSTQRAFRLMRNTSFWALEGFSVDDQPDCAERVSHWLNSAKAGRASRPLPAAPKDNLTLAEVLGGLHTLVDEEHSPAVARMLAEESVNQHLAQRASACRARRARQLTSDTSRHLFAELLGGMPAPRGEGRPPPAEQAAVSGELASADALEFAHWLSINASATAKHFHDMSFVYSSTSSNNLDSFATKLQGLTSRVENLLDLMMGYSTPEAIERLEHQLMGFADHSMKEVSAAVEKRLALLLNQSEPILESAIQKAAHTAGERLRQVMSDALKTPLGQALADPLTEVVGQVLQDANQSSNLGRQLGRSVSESVANLTAEAMGDAASDLVERLVSEALERGAKAADSAADRLSGVLDQAMGGKGHEAGLLALTEAHFRAEEKANGIPEAFAGGWESMVNMLSTLAEKLPMAVSSLTLARREVSKLHAALDTAFMVFEARGPHVFRSAADKWRSVWTLYFICLLPVNILILCYGFWAQGYFGGPAPSPKDEEVVEHPQTWRQCCAVAFRSCLWSSERFHDTQLCLWSALLSLQAIILVLFVAAVTLSILVGVETFAGDGCSQVYILGDSTLCTEALENLRDFLGRFSIFKSMEPLGDACGHEALLTCRVIEQRMKSSTAVTAAFSFLSAVLSVQMLIDSAIHHERACFRRLMRQEMVDAG
mmetsp:Transcript_41306/g.119519  ORF Transcript_41306/g.119519 Transcript_41306/m.119519 type:complete len:1046 (+) Transcript_41306:156-3293(+)